MIVPNLVAKFLDNSWQTKVVKWFIKCIIITDSENDIAEWENTIFTEKAHALLLDSKLPTYLWPKAVATAVYTMNQSPTSSNADFATPIVRL